MIYYILNIFKLLYKSDYFIDIYLLYDLKSKLTHNFAAFKYIMLKKIRPRRSMLYVPGCNRRYLEKAKQLNPKDEDIQVNSAFAQNMTIDAIENLPESQIAQFQKSLFGVFSFSTWSVLTVLLLWVFVGLFLGYLFFKSAQLKRSFFFSAMLVLLVFITSFFVTFTIDQQDKKTQYAILFSDQIDIWSEPNLQGDLLFTLHEGTKVQLLDKLEEWQKIRIANGSEGWIRNASLRKLESAITK